MKIRNVSSLGALDVPLLGRTVDGGEVVDVDSEQAARLLPQSGTWEPADAPAKKLASKIAAAAAKEV